MGMLRVGAGERDAGGSGEVVEVVADDGLEGYLHAEIVEGFGEEEGVGVLPVGREHLGTGGDDFSDHEHFRCAGRISRCKRYRAVLSDDIG
jgi:hypothetical protein